MQTTPNIENYLKGIYILQEKNDFSSKKLAFYLKVSQASVSEMLKKLMKKNYLTFEAKEISLTNKGKEIAVSIITKHRVWEVFLSDVLHFDSKDEIHCLAENLEHVTTNILLEKLIKFLGNPKMSPNGKKIYYESFYPSFYLDQIKLNESFKVLEIESSINSYAKNKNLFLNSIYKVVNVDFYNRALTLKNNNQEIVLASEVCKYIKVTKISEEIC